MAEADIVSRRAREEGYEPEDVRVRGVLAVAGASLVLLALVFLALWGMMRLFAESYPRPLPTGVERAHRAAGAAPAIGAKGRPDKIPRTGRGDP
jgi:hypothetical protein